KVTQAQRHRRMTPRSSSFKQLGILVTRYVDLVIQDWKNLSLILLQAPLIAFLMTLAAAKDTLTGKRPISDEAQRVILLMAIVSAWFGIINAAREIAKEAPIMQRERLAGVKTGAYLASKLVVLAGLVAIQSAALLTILHTKIDFPARGVRWTCMAELF